MNWLLLLGLAHIAPSADAARGLGADDLAALRAKVEMTYVCSMSELVEVGGHEQVAYRYRHVEFDVVEGMRQMSEDVDGVAFVRFDSDGLWSEQWLLDYDFDSSGIVVPRKTTTFHALTSGEYARSTLCAGGAEPLVILDRWTGVGSLPFLALRRVADRAMLRDLTLTATHALDATTTVIEFREPGGTEIDLHVESNVDATLRAVRTTRPTGQTQWTYFDGDAGRLADGTIRPATVLEISFDPTGEARDARIWSAVTADRAPDALAKRQRPGTNVIDMRDQSGSVAGRTLDREAPLDELLQWPGTMVESVATDVMQTKPVRQPAVPAPENERNWVLIAAITLCGTSAILFFRSSRSK